MLCIWYTFISPFILTKRFKDIDFFLDFITFEKYIFQQRNFCISIQLKQDNFDKFISILPPPPHSDKGFFERDM